MASDINPAWPIEGSPQTANVRANFQAAKDEIEALQASTSTLAGLTDTDITAPAAGHMLLYDGSDSWDNKALSGDATVSAAGALTLAATNTNLTTLANVTTVGTIGAGVWQGTAISQTYLVGQSGTNTGDEVSATTTTEGIVERSTSAENVTGTDDTVYPTVAGTKEMIDTHAAGAGANAALDNLASVALNTALLPDAAAADDFGSATLPFKDYFFAGSSGTPGTNNFKITGASTSGTRTITFPDATDTLVGKATTDTLSNKTMAAQTLSGEVSGADQTVTRVNLKDYGEITNAIGGTGGGAQDIDLELGNVVSATVDTSANTFTFSNPTASDEGCSFTLFLTNGGSQTVNWPASVDWAGGVAPTLTAAGVDVLTFMTIDGGTTWYGFAAGLDMQ